MTWRVRSVRRRILLLAPSPCCRCSPCTSSPTSITARNAINLARGNTLKNATGQPTGNFERAMQTGRLLAVLYPAAPTPANQAKLNAVERAIDTLPTDIKTLPPLQAQVADGHRRR